MSGSAPNWDSVLQAMISAGSAAASGNWQSAKDYSVTEFKKLTATGQLILQGLQMAASLRRKGKSCSTRRKTSPWLSSPAFI